MAKNSDPIDTIADLLGKHFLGLVRFIAGNSSKAHGGSLLLYSLRSFVTAATIFSLMAVYMSLKTYLGIHHEDDSLLAYLFDYVLGFPLILALVFFCLETFRLLILFLQNKSGDEEIMGASRSLAMIAGIAMFFIGIFAMIGLSIEISSLVEDRKSRLARLKDEEQLALDQVEHMKHLQQTADKWNEYASSRYGISFAGKNLDGMDLRGRKFSMAKFDHASMQNTNFDNCYLYRASFKNANCSNASFRGADLMDVFFTNTILENADFTGAYIDRAILVNAKTRNIVLEGATYRFEKSPWRIKQAQEARQAGPRYSR